MKVYVINEGAKQDGTLSRVPAWVFPTRNRAEAGRGEFAAEYGDYVAPEALVISEVELGPLEDAEVRTRVARKRLYESLRDEFLANCLDLFQAHPELESFSWNQEVYDDSRTGDSSLDVFQPTLKGGPGVGDLVHLVNGLTDSFDERELEDLFGDMNLVTVHRDGTVENEENYSGD